MFWSNVSWNWTASEWELELDLGGSTDNQVAEQLINRSMDGKLSNVQKE